MTQDYILARLLSNNAQWAEDVERAEPGFHTELAKAQTPKVSTLCAAPHPGSTMRQLSFRARFELPGVAMHNEPS